MTGGSADRRQLRVALLTREYPPEIYGGAGVHVEYLARELARRLELSVHAWGTPTGPATGHAAWDALAGTSPHLAALRAVSIDLSMAAAVEGTELVHSHTWYANFGGGLAKLLYGIPHVATVHSLEPLRPWKAEQLGGGYAVSSWVERTAYDAADAVIAVSAAMRDDVLRSYSDVDPGRVHVVHNGIDTEDWKPIANPQRARELGLDPDRPSVIFVGRITRQKGLPLFLRAAAQLPPEVQLVLCAGAPDTREIEAEVRSLVDGLAAERDGVVWIAEMLPRHDVVALLTAATVFACPSIYEPLGIVNLEAMACETAVVATATGGIPEVVVDGETGWLVPIEQATDGTGTPLDPERYVADLAAALVDAVSDPDRARERGVAGRRRAQESFSWPAIAEQTMTIYRSLVKG